MCCWFWFILFIRIVSFRFFWNHFVVFISTLFYFQWQCQKKYCFPCRNAWNGTKWSIMHIPYEPHNTETEMKMLNATWLAQQYRKFARIGVDIVCVCVCVIRFARDVCYSPLFILWFKYFIVCRGFSNNNNNNTKSFIVYASSRLKLQLIHEIIRIVSRCFLLLLFYFTIISIDWMSI